ncbi:MAG TPA: hypothetical protein VGM81_20000 [Burkholderiaceae bacterium]|jgi:ppGpp synthetase/RelA/SpoT-type nucleotidyltranferase
MAISQSQLTKLGERLKQELTPADLRLLDEYRRSFTDASDEVVGVIRSKLNIQATVRSAKSTQAIIEKLRRQSVRLGQIQDIAGCRIVVEALAHQDVAVNQLRDAFPGCHLDDRRVKPSHFYRAVHLIVKTQDRWVEIQVRTALQHLWASLSEKLADEFGNEIKYGLGHSKSLTLLEKFAAYVEAREELSHDTSLKLTSDELALLAPLAAGQGVKLIEQRGAGFAPQEDS